MRSIVAPTIDHEKHRGLRQFRVTKKITKNSVKSIIMGLIKSADIWKMFSKLRGYQCDGKKITPKMRSIVAQRIVKHV